MTLLNCSDGSCCRCGAGYEVMREEYNHAADERDEFKAELAEVREQLILLNTRYVARIAEREALRAHVKDLEGKLLRAPWVDGVLILQGEHEADASVIGMTFAGIKKDLEYLQNQNSDLKADVKQLNWQLTVNEGPDTIP